MTENKPIYVDGVDVSECRWYTQSITGMICADWHLSNDCCKNPNCYYKQLARKTQECEELKEENFTFEQLIKEYEKYGVIEEIVQRLDQLKAAKEQTEQKFEQIRKRIQAYVDDKTDLTPEQILQIIDRVK